MRKRDKATTIGLFLGALAIIIGMGLNNNKLDLGGLKLFYDLPSVFITVGGSFFTILICFPMSIIKRLPSILKNAFFDKHYSHEEIIERFVELSKKARKEGLLSLEDQIEGLEDEFLKNGLRMVVDGLEPETIREIMELEISAMEKRHNNGVNVLKAWAGYGPAYGMIGTLIGLVQMLASLNDPGSLGPGMAKAIITSFYGSVMANFIFGPLASKLETKTEEEAEIREMMMEGVLFIQTGVNPRVIEDKLKTYLSPEERLKFIKEKAEGEAVLENE
jgi:chemotaxis protein MotA